MTKKNRESLATAHSDIDDLRRDLKDVYEKINFLNTFTDDITLALNYLAEGFSVEAAAKNKRTTRYTVCCSWNFLEYMSLLKSSITKTLEQNEN